jgi:hypothetical protein
MHQEQHPTWIARDFVEVLSYVLEIAMPTAMPTGQVKE